MDTIYAVVLFVVHISIPKVLRNVNKVKRKESVLESHSQYSYALKIENSQDWEWLFS